MVLIEQSLREEDIVPWAKQEVGDSGSSVYVHREYCSDDNRVHSNLQADMIVAISDYCMFSMTQI